MKVLIGSNNPSKVRFMAEMLGRLGEVECLSPADLGISISVEENGSSAVDNARLKAAAFHKASGLPVLCEDSGLYFAEFPMDDPRQPGIHARRIGGKTLDDEEMIAYYSALAKQYGTLHACYSNAYAAADANGRVEVFFQDDPRDPVFFDAFGFLLCDTPHPHREPGWPIDALSKDPYFERYYYDIADNEFLISALDGRRAAKACFRERWDRFMCVFFQL